jgi:Flp pilus assembly secretin CpaC
MKNSSFGTPVLLRSLFCLFLAIGAFSLGARADDVVVMKGSSVRIPVAEGVKSISVSNPTAIDARPGEDGKSVLVNGLTEGNSELRISRLQGDDVVTNVVVHADLKEILEQIKALLSDVEGLTVSVIGNKVVLKGNLLTKADYDEVSKVVEAFPNVILNMSTFDRSQMDKYVEQAILKDIGLDTVTAHVMGDTAILEGIAYSQADVNRAIEVAKLRMPNVKSLLRVQEVMVETDVQFIQVNGDKNKNIGFNVLDSLGVSLNGSGSGGPAAGGAFPISFGASATAALQVKALLGDGAGKIMAQPHLSTKSGEIGKFQSGGTKYFSVAGNVGGSLQSVDYGVILNVKPTLQGRDRILNEVTVEVSMPVADATGVLTLQKYSTTCTSLCKVGESMVLSGFNQQISTSTGSKTPILGDVPLLSLFFSNKSSDTQTNQFIILVTPRPIFPSVATGPAFSEENKQLLQDSGSK